MRLARQTKQWLKYELNQQEGDCLRSLLRQFPVTGNVHAKISKTDADPKSIEREKLLDESLIEHRKELKKQATNLIGAGKLKHGDKGYLLTLNPDDREILLQILNDIRIGCWHVLGDPDELEPETPPQNENEMVFYNLMNLAGYFEVAFLHAPGGDSQTGYD
jgi:hypothetical protein